MNFPRHFTFNHYRFNLRDVACRVRTAEKKTAQSFGPTLTDLRIHKVPITLILITFPSLKKDNPSSNHHSHLRHKTCFFWNWILQLATVCCKLCKTHLHGSCEYPPGRETLTTTYTIRLAAKIILSTTFTHKIDILGKSSSFF